MKEKLINPKMYKAKDMWAYFKKTTPKVAVKYTYDTYKEVISRYNKMVEDEILRGTTVSIGNKLGSFRIKKIKRLNVMNNGRIRGRGIDWHKMKELKKQGINKYVFFTSPYYYMHSWRKGAIGNKSVYSFIPTKGPDGNVKRLAHLLTTDTFAELNFSE